MKNSFNCLLIKKFFMRMLFYQKFLSLKCYVSKTLFKLFLSIYYKYGCKCLKLMFLQNQGTDLNRTNKTTMPFSVLNYNSYNSGKGVLLCVAMRKKKLLHPNLKCMQMRIVFPAHRNTE